MMGPTANQLRKITVIGTRLLLGYQIRRVGDAGLACLGASLFLTLILMLVVSYGRSVSCYLSGCISMISCIDCHFVFISVQLVRLCSIYVLC